MQPSNLPGQTGNVLSLFSKIKTFVFDVDGVLTNGEVILVGDGLQARTMNVKDGLALQMALKNGYRVMVISGAYSEPVVQRMHYLGIKELYTAVKDKAAFLEEYVKDHQLQWEEVLFMGDDLPDLGLLSKAGLAACPADAVAEVQQVAHFISSYEGGKGCVREVIEKVLKLNGHWNFDVSITSR
jgi:3-deoxy-D-manno-octulosonate 8-phosphate phosphatase (KDO 8-P phosphatase)